METPTTKPPAVPKKPRLSLRKKIPLYLLLIILIVGPVLAYAALHGNTQAKLMYYQYQVERLDLSNGSPNRIMYRVSPALAIAADPNQFLSIPGQSWPAPHHHAASDAHDDDDCELLPPHVIPTGGVGDPEPLDMFNQYAQSILGDDMQVLFAHQLTAASGPRPIVIAESGIVAGTTDRLEFEILFVEPANWSSLPKLIARQRIEGSQVGLTTGTTNFYAGQTDASDPATFHLAIDQGPHHITLTGHLTPDGRNVTLKNDTLTAR